MLWNCISQNKICHLNVPPFGLLITWSLSISVCVCHQQSLAASPSFHILNTRSVQTHNFCFKEYIYIFYWYVNAKKKKSKETVVHDAIKRSKYNTITWENGLSDTHKFGPTLRLQTSDEAMWLHDRSSFHQEQNTICRHFNVSDENDHTNWQNQLMDDDYDD